MKTVQTPSYSQLKPSAKVAACENALAFLTKNIRENFSERIVQIMQSMDSEEFDELVYTLSEDQPLSEKTPESIRKVMQDLEPLRKNLGKNLFDQELLDFIKGLHDIEHRKPLHADAKVSTFIRSEKQREQMEEVTEDKILEYIYFTVMENFFKNKIQIPEGSSFVTISDVRKPSTFHDHVQKADVVLHLSNGVFASVDVTTAQNIETQQKKLRGVHGGNAQTLQSSQEGPTVDSYTRNKCMVVGGVHTDVLSGIQILHNAHGSGKDALSVRVVAPLSSVWKNILIALPEVMQDMGESTFTKNVIEEAFQLVYGTRGEEMLQEELNTMELRLQVGLNENLLAYAKDLDQRRNIQKVVDTPYKDIASTIERRTASAHARHWVHQG